MGILIPEGKVRSRYLFTSESVTEGHPDKLADQISDAVLDAILEQDPAARVACETLLTTGMVLVSGEITTGCYVEIPALARKTLETVGYTHSDYGIDAHTCAVLTSINEQAPDIAMGVDRGGAGDQGMMFGYATNETPELMPMPIMLAHRLSRRLAEVRKNGTLPWLRPDGKSQVSVEYEVEGNCLRPVRVDQVLISAQHDDDVDAAILREAIIDLIIRPVIPAEMVDSATKEPLINPTGKFVVGGPQGDTGLTGRKVIVDTYGGMAHHGGGAFSGKDPTKVDRSGAYMMRYLARQVVAAELAERCEIQVAYAIGEASPVSLYVNTFGTGKLPDARIGELINDHFDLTPAGIIARLDLRRPIYQQVAAYGHFGRTDLDLPWEKDDMAATLRAAANC